MEDIILFGHGRYYKNKEENIKKMYRVAAFIDNAIKKDEVLFDGAIPMYNPEQINKLPFMPVMIMSANFMEMAMQLVELGVDDKLIRFAVGIPPYYDQVELLFCDLKCRIQIEDKKFALLCGKEKYLFDNEAQYKETLRKIMAAKDPHIQFIADMPLQPLSRRFGLEFGKAIDRFYIEKFLYDNKKYISGTVMEIAEDRYIKMFGENILKFVMLHVNGWGEDVVKGDLSTGEGIVENSMDCLICTQTLQFIYDIHSVVKNIYKLLKPGGTALITVPLISQISLYDYKNWGCYWRFTDQSLRKLLSECFLDNRVEISTYGNMKASIAFLYGICQEEMKQSDLEYHDEQFPLIIGAVCRKE